MAGSVSWPMLTPAECIAAGARPALVSSIMSSIDHSLDNSEAHDVMLVNRTGVG